MPAVTSTIVLHPSGDESGATDIADINAALAAHSSVVLEGGGTDIRFHINSPILQPSNTTLTLRNAEVFLVDGSNCNIWRNANQTVDGDEHIYIRGIGRALFNGNASNQERQEVPKGDGSGVDSFIDNIGMSAVRVDELHVDGIQIGPTNGWGAFLQGVTNSTWRNINWEQDVSTTYQDGIDIGMGCSNIVIENHTGRTGDDFSAVMAITWWSTSGAGVDGIHPLYYVGSALPKNVSNITWRNIKVHCGVHALRVFSDSTATVKNLVAEDIHNLDPDSAGGLFAVSHAYTNPAHPPAVGSVSGITLRGLVGDCRLAGKTVIALDGHCDRLTVSGLDLQLGVFPHAIIGTNAQNLAGQASSFVPTVREVLIEDVKAIATGSAFVGDVMNFRAEATVTDFEVRNVHLKEAQAVLNNASTAVTNLRLRNIHIGKCYRIPFNSATAETGDIADVQVDSLNTGVTKRYGTAMAAKLGPGMPIFTSTDTVPVPSRGSRITCDHTLDPTGGAGTDAGDYVGDGSDWLLVANLGTTL